MDEYQTESGQVGYLEFFEQRRGETLPLMLPVRGEPAFPDSRRFTSGMPTIGHSPPDQSGRTSRSKGECRH